VLCAAQFEVLEVIEKAFNFSWVSAIEEDVRIGLNCLQGPRETNVARGQSKTLGGNGDCGTDKIVGGHPKQQFFLHRVCGFGGQLLHRDRSL